MDEQGHTFGERLRRFADWLEEKRNEGDGIIRLNGFEANRTPEELRRCQIVVRRLADIADRLGIESHTVTITTVRDEESDRVSTTVGPAKPPPEPEPMPEGDDIFTAELKLPDLDENVSSYQSGRVNSFTKDYARDKLEAKDIGFIRQLAGRQTRMQRVLDKPAKNYRRYVTYALNIMTNFYYDNDTNPIDRTLRLSFDDFVRKLDGITRGNGK